MKATATPHAVWRLKDRLKLDADKFLAEFNFLRYNVRYVDKTGGLHIYVPECHAEIIGKFNYGRFVIFTALQSSTYKFNVRRKEIALNKEW